MSVIKRILGKPVLEDDAGQQSWDPAQPLELQLANLLSGNGIPATYEHPGYVSVPTAAGELSVGTLDGYWSADLPDGMDDSKAQPLIPMMDRFKDKEPSRVAPIDLLWTIGEMVRHLGSRP